MTHTDILNALVEANDYKSYLEIGVESSPANFDKITATDKVGVDPTPDAAAILPMTSDEYFEKYPRARFDLIFIDGLHHAEQVGRDIHNSLKALNPGGTIVVHDCNPTTEELQKVPNPNPGGLWTGDVWKAFATVRHTNPHLRTFVVDTDYGCGIIQQNPQRAKARAKGLRPDLVENLTYEVLEKHRQPLLNLITVDELYTWLGVDPDTDIPATQPEPTKPEPEPSSVDKEMDRIKDGTSAFDADNSGLIGGQMIIPLEADLEKLINTLQEYRDHGADSLKIGHAPDSIIIQARITPDPNAEEKAELQRLLKKHGLPDGYSTGNGQAYEPKDFTNKADL